MSLPDNLIPSASRTYIVPAERQPEACGSASTWDALRLRGIIPSFGASSCQCRATFPDKSSADVLDYAVDFSAWLADTGDTIETVLVTYPDTTGLTYDLTDLWADAYQGETVVVMLASGRPGTKQRVVVTVETVEGRTKAVPIEIKITRATPATDPPATVQIPADATVNGGVWMVGNTPLKLPLYSNGGVIMTEDADHPPTAAVVNRTDPTSNIGVLMDPTWSATTPVLPPDTTANGGVIMAGATPLPDGLTSNGGVVMAVNPNNVPDGTRSNGGVLVAAS